MVKEGVGSLVASRVSPEIFFWFGVFALQLELQQKLRDMGMLTDTM